MKLKNFLLLQLTLFFGLTIMVVYQRNEEAAQSTQKEAKKIEVPQVSQPTITSTTPIIK